MSGSPAEVSLEAEAEVTGGSKHWSGVEAPAEAADIAEKKDHQPVNPRCVLIFWVLVCLAGLVLVRSSEYLPSRLTDGLPGRDLLYCES